MPAEQHEEVVMESKTAATASPAPDVNGHPADIASETEDDKARPTVNGSDARDEGKSVASQTPDHQDDASSSNGNTAVTSDEKKQLNDTETSHQKKKEGKANKQEKDVDMEVAQDKPKSDGKPEAGDEIQAGDGDKKMKPTPGSPSKPDDASDAEKGDTPDVATPDTEKVTPDDGMDTEMGEGDQDDKTEHAEPGEDIDLSEPMATDEDAAAKGASAETPIGESKDDASPATAAAASSGDVDIASSNISQLAIDKDDGEPSGDVSMTDAPAPEPESVASGTKTARGRDEDEDVEPAAKRARTEIAVEGDDDGSNQAGNDAKDLPTTGEPALDALPHWLDSALDKTVIDAYHCKQYRHYVSLARKTTAGLNFKDSVEKLWPALWESYQQRVPSPIDLGEIDRNLRDKKYDNVGQLRDDLGLIYINCIKFNGREHNLVNSALSVIDTLWHRIIGSWAQPSPPEKPAKATPSRHTEPRSKPVPPPPPPASPPRPSQQQQQEQQQQKQKQQEQQQQQQQQQQQEEEEEEQRQRQQQLQQQKQQKQQKQQQQQPAPAPLPPQRRQSSSAVVSPSDKSSDQTYAIPPGGVPQIRRASTLSEGNRPKRAIHAPKSKDIDYAIKPSKSLKPELQFCNEVLTELTNQKHGHLNFPFLTPVDPVALQIPTYFTVIKKPMDLGTIGSKLAAGEYQNAKQFDSDVRLVFSNCFKFNAPDTGVYHQGKNLESLYKAEFSRKNQWLAKNAPKDSPPPPAALNSDSDADSDVDEDDDEGSAAPDPYEANETIRMLQEKMATEMRRLTEMFGEAKPNQSLLTLQQNMIDVIQDRLVKEKALLLQKSGGGGPAGGAEKPSKSKRPFKSAKPAKTKPAQNATSSSKKSAGAPRKTSAPKKRVFVLTHEQKDLIAQSISSLNPPYLDSAIEVIKSDTGQLENPDGELELELDQISDEAMNKLWDLCRKSIPDFGKHLTSDNSPSAPTKQNKAAPAKPRQKSKPMSAAEQEEAIERLSAVEARFKGNVAPKAATSAPSPSAQNALANFYSSDEDSSSEEE